MPARLCLATLSAISPYSPSRKTDDVKGAAETHDQMEERIWRNKAHVENDRVFIPPMAFKFSLDRAAKTMGRQIPGKGKATYTKFFESGVLVVDPVFISTVSEMKMERIYANTDGVRGSGNRGWRCFPRMDNWAATVPFHVLADELPKDVFAEALEQAGMFVGVGRFRPQNGGFFGRFKIDRLDWK